MESQVLETGTSPEPAKPHSQKGGRLSRTRWRACTKPCSAMWTAVDCLASSP